MHKKSQQKLIEELEAAGLIQNSANRSPASRFTPWYIKLLHGFSGWLASVFLLFALGAAFHSLFDSRTVLIILGLVFVTVAYMILKNQNDNIFTEQFAVAISLAGQAMVVFGLLNILGRSSTDSYASTWYIVAIFEAILAIIVPNYLHRFLSSLIFTYSFLAASFMSGSGAAAVSIILGFAVWVWFSEYRHSKWIDTKQPVGYGLSLGLISYGWLDDVPFYYATDSSGYHLFGQHWVSTGINTAILLYIVWYLTNRYNGATKVLAAAFALLIGTVSLSVVGLEFGIVLLLVAFSRGNVILTGIGIAQLIWSIGHYYYALQATLLVKSFYLMGSGILLLVLYYLFKRYIDNAQRGDSK